MQTLLERLEWVLSQGLVDSKRSWSIAAGKTHSQVASLMQRLKEDPSSGVENETLEALARAAKVSVGWLSHGIGAYDDPPTRELIFVPDRRCESLERVIAARGAQYSEAAIVQARSKYHSNGLDPGEQSWDDFMNDITRAERRLEREQARARLMPAPEPKPEDEDPQAASRARIARVAAKKKGKGAKR